MINVPRYRQTDPAWASTPLCAGTTRTLGSHGCLITCLAMLSYNTGHNLNPREMRDALDKEDGLTDGGEVWWMSLGMALPKVHFVDRMDTDLSPDKNHLTMRVDQAIKRVNRLVEMGCPVPINVDNINHDGRPDHWVLMVDKFGKPDNMHDPASGETEFESRYGEPQKGLFGFASVVGPQLSYPENSDYPSGAALWKLKEWKAGRGRDNYIDEAISHLLAPR